MEVGALFEGYSHVLLALEMSPQNRALQLDMLGELDTRTRTHTHTGTHIHTHIYIYIYIYICVLCWMECKVYVKVVVDCSCQFL